MCKSLLLLIAITASAPAQTQPMLMGLSRTTPVLTHLDMTNCAVQTCVGLLGPAVLPYAGGTAHDGMTGLTWVSNGTSMTAFAPRNCNSGCTAFAAPVPAGMVLTALAAYEPTRTLFVVDSGNGVLRLTLGSCTPSLQFQRCVVSGLLPNQIIGGMAASDTSNLVFYAASNWTGAPNNTIYVGAYNSPCSVPCRFAVPNCGALTLGPITGLAFDDWHSVLWVTDGRQIMGLQYDRVTCTATQVVQCCAPAASTEPLVGLCVDPSHATALGSSCTNLQCAACTGMQHTTRGDAMLNNNYFALRLEAAPAQQRAFLAVNAGTCQAGLSVAPLCGPFRVPAANMILVGPILLGGTAGCTGSAIVSLPIPNNVTLCGVPLSSQFLVLCQNAAGVGTGVSNCLSWMVTGS